MTMLHWLRQLTAPKHLKVVQTCQKRTANGPPADQKNDYAGVLKEHDDKLMLTLANNNPSQSKLIRQGLSLAKIKLALQNRRE